MPEHFLYTPNLVYKGEKRFEKKVSTKEKVTLKKEDCGGTKVHMRYQYKV
jgi:hypothetical protein